MKTILILLVTSVLLFSPDISYGTDMPTNSSFMDLESSIKALQLYVKRVRKSIVTVVVYDSSGIMRSGSGLFVDREGRIVTNALIMKDAYSAEVYSETSHYEQVAILSKREDFDIALIQVKANNEVPIELDYEYIIELGERVVVVGKSSDFRTTVSEGLITAKNSIGDISDFIKIETAGGILSYKYSMNGPVINMEGKVIGITVKDVSGFEEEGLFSRDYYGEVLNAVSVRSIKTLLISPYHIESLHPAGTKK